MATEKVLDRIEKLLRVAALDSGAPLPERENAALRACELIVQHGISLRETVPARAPWVLSLAPYHCGCNTCGQMISPRDVVWIRVLPNHDILFRHNYGTCAVE